MPLYTFELCDGECRIGDETGMWFPDREPALDHAHDVARELMTAREVADAELASRRLRGRQEG
jgi:hypothetical protein